MLNKKKDFPYFLKDDAYVYLDTAATSLKPKKVIDALCSFYSNDYATVHRAIYTPALVATEKYEETRKTVQQFLNAHRKEEIIFTKGTTDSINLVANSFKKKFINKNDEIIVCQTEHHSNIVPWQIVCKEKQAKLKVALVNDKAEIDLDYLKKIINKRTRLICIAHMANATGTIHPIKEIVKLARKFDVRVLIDGAQAVAHIKVDVQDLDVDFYAFSSHKLYGPTGVGILYAKYDLLEEMPPVQGGGDMIETVCFKKDTTYQKPPLKFEAGTPNIADVVVFKNAIEYVEEIGLDNISKWENYLLELTQEKMAKIDGLKIIGTSNNKGGIISFVVDGAHPLDIGTMLDSKKIAIRTGHHCSQPTMEKFNVDVTCRASFGVYNTKEDVLYFIDSLIDVLKKLKLQPV